ncbi:MAG: replicative DNA helicase [Polyangiaceae bacterium]
MANSERRPENRIPPHDLGAEAAVLSAVLVDPAALGKAHPPLEPEHFYAEAHRRIFEAAIDLGAQGKPVDVVQVASWLRDHQRLAQAGGTAYCTEILDAAPAVANVEAYARTVHAKWRMRQAILLAQRIVAEGYGGGGDGDADAFVERAEASFYKLARESSTRSRGKPMADVVSRAFDAMRRGYDTPGAMLGVSHGLRELDAITGGLHPGEQTILAARPGMGKTALMLHIATTVARAGRGVLIFSFEMPDAQLGMRAICGGAGVDIQRARTNRFDDDDWSKMVTAASELTKPRHWYVEDLPATMAEIRGIVRMRHAEMRREGMQLGLVAIDFAQIIRPPRDLDPRDRVGERALTLNARAGKELAKEIEAPVLLLSQLNRGPEQRQDHRPILADLRESGALEESADVAIGLFRQEYYAANCVNPEVAELIVLKQRNGPCGTVQAGYDKRTTTFYDLDEAAE